MRGRERGAVQALRAGEIQVGFVDRGHFNLGRKCLKDFEDLARVLAIASRVAIDEYCVRAESRGRAQRHGRVDTELARGLGRGRDHTALVGLPANDHGLAHERGIEEFFDGDEEGVHVDVEIGPHRILGYSLAPCFFRQSVQALTEL